MKPSHIFMLNLAYEWMLLLLLRPFYEPEMQKLAFAGTSARDQDDDGEASPTHGTQFRPQTHAEDVRRIARLANEECPKSAQRVLELLNAYHGLYSLRRSPVTSVQIAYHAGKTFLKIVVAGGGAIVSGKGKKAIQAGMKAREKVRECVAHLRAIGESWASGGVTAEMLEKELEAEIERQDKDLGLCSVTMNSLGQGPSTSAPAMKQRMRSGSSTSSKTVLTPSPSYVLIL